MLVRYLLFSVMTFALCFVLLACQGETTTVEVPADTPTPQPTYTPYPSPEQLPTHTPYPTLVPLPTFAPLPTLVPLPTHTPQATLEPLPTHTPQSTLEALPTYTPYPTPEPQPTYTPVPTLTPVVRTVVQRDNWKVDDADNHMVLGNSPTRGAWLLSATCFDDGDLAVWLWHALGRIFGSGTSGDQSLLADFDGDSQEQTWFYIAADEDDDDFFSANWPRNVIEKLLESEKVVYTIPTSGQSYVVTFDVAGLDRHIKTPEDLCR